MTVGSRLTNTQRIVMAALCAAVLGVAAPAHAADLGLTSGRHARHVRISQPDWTWRDRCAYAGYYCLYAEYAYVYHYPFDDRPIAHAYYRRGFR
jgi:hypothetical protein